MGGTSDTLAYSSGARKIIFLDNFVDLYPTFRSEYFTRMNKVLKALSLD